MGATQVNSRNTSTRHLHDGICDRVDARLAVGPTGLILVDRAGECMYINSTAEQVLCYPKPLTSDSEIIDTVREQIRSRVLPLCSKCATGTFVSGRRTYIYRTLVLEVSANGREGPTTAVVVERTSRRNENLRRLSEQYKFTPREREVLILLTEGLTSKEIAQRMNISAHTVKGFVRLIMLKVGVTTRSGIVGKFNSS